MNASQGFLAPFASILFIGTGFPFSSGLGGNTDSANPPPGLFGNGPDPGPRPHQYDVPVGFELDQDPVELWEAELRVLVDDEEVVILPFVEVRLEP